VAGPCEEVQFGLIEIDWGSGSSPELTLSAINVYGEAVFSHRIQFPRH
jgi:hypothetical protein